MLYSSIDELPAAVRAKLDEKDQRQFLAVFNSIMEQSDDESRAMAGAYAAVNKSWSATAEIIGKNDDQQIAFGWLSVAIDKAGNVIEDSQGDIIDPEDLESAAYEFVLTSRKAGDMHERVEGIGRLVESMMFTKEKQTALGIPEGVLPVGWFVGFKVDDSETWAKIKKGEYSAFSIGGRGVRESV